MKKANKILADVGYVINESTDNKKAVKEIIVNEFINNKIDDVFEDIYGYADELADDISIDVSEFRKYAEPVFNDLKKHIKKFK